MADKKFNFPKPFRLGGLDSSELSQIPELEEDSKYRQTGFSKASLPNAVPDPDETRAVYTPTVVSDKRASFSQIVSSPKIVDSKTIAKLDDLMKMDVEEIINARLYEPPPQPKHMWNEEQEREAALKLNLLVEKLKLYKQKLIEMKKNNFEMSKLSFERQLKLQQLEIEKEELEKELNFLGIDRNNRNKLQSFPIIAKSAYDEQESRKRMEAKRDLLTGIALVDGDFADFLGKEDKQKNILQKLRDALFSILNRFVLLKKDLKYVESRYDKSISAYFAFTKYLVNSSIAIFAIYAYLLISHIVYRSEMFSDVCGGSPCWTLYFSFETDEDFPYSLSLILMLVVTIISSILKWIRSDAFKKRAEIYGGQDAKLKKFASITFNAWDWNVQGAGDTEDQIENISTTMLLALRDEARLKAASNRTAQQKAALYTRRVITTIVFIFILSAGWIGIAALVMTEKDFVSSISTSGTMKLLATFIPKLLISIINSSIPTLALKITYYENWDDPAFTVKMSLIRLYLVKILNVILYAVLNLELASDNSWFGSGSRIEFEDNDNNCREDQAGVNLVLMVISEAIMCKVIPLVLICVNKLKARIKKQPWVKAEIKVAQQIINIIYFQALVWVTFPFFPYVAFLAPVLLFLDFKFQKMRLIKFQSKPAQMTQASDIVIFIMRIYNLSLALAVVYIAYFLVEPLNHLTYDDTKLCGPFPNETEAKNPVTDFLEDTPVLAQIWNYFLYYPPALWIVTILLATKVGFLKIESAILKQYTIDREAETSYQIQDLQRSLNKLRTQMNLNKNIDV